MRNGCFALWRYVLRPGDSDEEITRKRLVVTTFVPIFFLSVFGIAINLQWMIGAAFWGSIMGLTAAAATITWAVVMRTMPLWIIESAVLGIIPAILLTDWSTAAAPGAARQWVFAILAMDILLVVNARHWVHGVCLHSVGLWLIVTSVEDGWRLGVYDVGFVAPPDDYIEERGRCARPPCASGLSGGISKIIVYLFVLYVDYLVSRRFAEGQRREREAVLAGIRVAEQIAGCLVRFDLEAAEDELSYAQDFTPGLAASLRLLLLNLASYRPYLPDSCFAEEADVRSPCAEIDRSTLAADPTPRSRDDQPAEMVVPRGAPFFTPSGLPRAGSVGAGSSCASPPHVPTRASSFGACGDGLSVLPRANSNLDKSVESGSCAASPVGAQPRGRRSLGSAAPDETESRSPADWGAGLNASPRQRLPGESRPPSSLSGKWLGNVAQYKRVSMLCANRSGFLRAAATALVQTQRSGPLHQWFAAEVERFTVTVQVRKGVVDLLSGDHQHAIFGAMRTLGSHQISAVACATVLGGLAQPVLGEDAEALQTQHLLEHGAALLGSLARSVAVCSGFATCGDFGSSHTQRYMVVGAVSSFVRIVERIATGWGVSVLIDGDVHADAEMNWDCRIRKMVSCSKRDNGKPTGLWEVLTPRVLLAPSHREWMYEMECAAPNEWQNYNNAVTLWCRGDIGAALRAAHRGMLHDMSASAQGAVSWLRDTLADTAAAAAEGREPMDVPNPPLVAIAPLAGDPLPVLEPDGGPERQAAQAVPSCCGSIYSGSCGKAPGASLYTTSVINTDPSAGTSTGEGTPLERKNSVSVTHTARLSVSSCSGVIQPLSSPPTPLQGFGNTAFATG